MEEKTYFDFATVGNYTLSVDYKLKFISPIEFYVYDEYPFVAVEGDPELEVLRVGLNPILKGLTENYGIYNGIVNIKKSVKKLYVYSPTLGVPQLLKSSFANNKFTVDANSPASFMAAQMLVKSSNVLELNASIPGYTTLGTWSSTGVPFYLLSPDISVSAEFMNDINATLPESKKVPILHPEFIANGVNSALHIIENAKIEVVFIHEGASYKNVLGYFHYPTDNPPTKLSEISKIIAFPNASFLGSGGGLLTGNRVQLQYWNGSALTDIFPAGTSIGWFIAAYSYQSNGTISQNNPIYYSLEQFNPESDPLLKPHNVLLYDPERDIVLIGFEDVNRSLSSDNDFNDALFYAAATPETAIQYKDLPLVIKTNDKDKDGIPDDRDEFPNDANIAYSTHYPSINSYHTLAFEDLWPSRGDYDMNDVVVSYNSTHYLNNKNQIIKIIDRIKPVWSGGILDVGFGYQLGLSASAVSSVKSTSTFVDGNFSYQLSPNGTEQQQNKAVVMVFDNITALGIKVVGDKPEFSIQIDFSSPVTLDLVTTPPYNPFIVVNNAGRGREVHMPNYLPTDLADSKLLGSSNDKSDPKQNRYYISDDGMPFGILIPGDFDYPTESVSIGIYYPKFLVWAKSLGVDCPDWYLYKK
ncbi:MAG: hypothetical protein A2X18_01525 [Bacteroidetes bacterium GWF2_40_14]|nr:MAG: hypothetical protein A2X18_01525 [Bacteroidetes bacterium GWF2_40_14]